MHGGLVMIDDGTGQNDDVIIKWRKHDSQLSGQQFLDIFWKPAWR